ncbi:MAG: aromatic ring-hydroxylating dioxygenase subunit alpha [Gammaproteobacteria bacterium]
MNAFEQIIADLGRVKPPLSAAATLPPLCYTDPDWQLREAGQIFARGWVALGREDRWRRRGDYVALDLPGAPLLIMRDRELRLRAWANSCRHRGMKLLCGEGRRNLVVCPFHAWTYALNGELVSAPRMPDGFDPGAFGLTEFRLECRDGFAFVCLDSGQAGLDDWLGDFSQVHHPWALGDARSTRVREFEVECNWKLFIEVFNEYYHLPCVHPQSLAGAYREPDPPDEVRGAYTTQFGVTEGSAALLEAERARALPQAARLNARERSGTRYTWVYPNLTFAAGGDALWMYQAYPLGAARCRVIQTIAFPREALESEEFAARAPAYYRRIDAALEEDLPFLRGQQAGLASRFARPGCFSELEPCVGNFACWYARAMRA